MKLLMITGDRALAQGKRGPFYYMLEEFSKHWERIDIICPQIRNPKSEIRNPFNNVFIHSSPWPIIFQPWFILKKGQEIYREQKFDLFTVHGYPPFYNDLGGRWLHEKIKVPYVLEIMHITGYPKAGNFKDWFYKILTKYFIKFSAKKAKAVRVINQKQTPEFLIKAGVDEKKIRVVPAFYIDLEVFKPKDLEKEYDLVFAGRLTRNKGVNLLLPVIEKLKTETPDIKLMIIGTGPLENKIKNYIKRNRLENNVILSGWLSNIEEVAEIYNQSKIFVMLSFNEGGPRVNLEAMACKIPVITTKVGIMIDIIKDWGNGVFINWDIEDIAEKILLLLQDKNLRKKIAENGYQTVQQFERKQAIQRYAESYKKLINVRNV